MIGLKDAKEYGNFGLLALVLVVGGVDLGKTDGISQQLNHIDKRVTLVEYRLEKIERGGNDS